MKVLKNLLAMGMAILLAASLLPFGALANGDGGAPDLSRKGTRIGVGAGTVQEKLVSELFPDAEVFYYHHLDGYAALAQGKLDAFVFDKKQMELAIKNGLGGVRLLDGSIGEATKIAIGISNESEIPDLENRVNSFVRELKRNGTLDDMYDRWVVREDFSMPEIEGSDAPTARLIVGTTGIAPPYTFYEGTELTGYDIELMYRLAAWLGADAEFEVYDYAGVVQAAQTGKVDVVAANLQVTPERAEALTFSETLYEEETGVLVRDTGTTSGAQGQSGVQWQDYNGKRIGVMTGSIHDSLVERRLPSAQIVYFTEPSDMLAALETGKIDAFAWPKSGAVFMRYEGAHITWLDESLQDGDLGFIFPKTEEGRDLNRRFSDFVLALRADGTLDTLIEKWFGEDESVKNMIDCSAIPAINGTLRMATAANAVPFTYVRDGTVVGFEIELAALFCVENGYGLQVEQMNFDGVLASVQTGKCDFGGSCLAVTEERQEQVDFSASHYTNSVVLVIPDDAGAAARASFLDGVISSFEKTFLRENRWMLFAQGIWTTMLITVLSILFGTALGFGVYLLCRNGNPIANAVTRFCVWLVQGMPVVVLLMILYYIIFAKSSISGSAVSVAGFTLVFGAAVYGMLRAGVGAVPRGQTEAAYALGYGNARTFFRMILPQAIPHFLPAYKGEMVALIKATAVVGYIAVQDLTKMGDIVRGRTYEAFFPLIAVAVIYYLLAAILTFAVNRLEITVNPKRRKKADILKGVEIHD